VAMETEVWLIKSRTNPFPVKGQMSFNDGQVQVLISGGADCVGAMREYLQEQTGIEGLADRLKDGEVVKVLEFAPSQAEVSFPATAGGYIAKIDVDGKTWYVALAYPAGGGIQNVLSMKKGRKLAKEWKPVLA
jgi:hypothetical protein